LSDGQFAKAIMKPNKAIACMSHIDNVYYFYFISRFA